MRLIRRSCARRIRFGWRISEGCFCYLYGVTRVFFSSGQGSPVKDLLAFPWCTNGLRIGYALEVSSGEGELARELA